ncbi:hypothetical protein ACROYT_G022546 [Oculina patagonica]
MISRTPSPPRKVEFNSTFDFNCQAPSERLATPNSFFAGHNMYTPDVAPSLLAWLMGAKDCLEDNIPELANANKHKETIANQQRKKDRDFVLPDCLSYHGYHEYGFHLFTLNSSVFNSTIQGMSFDCISEAIASVLGESTKPFVIVYKDIENKTTYLPDPPAWGREVLERICTRFGEQLLRVIIYQPSWFFQIVLDEQTDGTGFFSAAVTKKLRITSNFKELAKLTGFPGEIKSTY